MPSPSRFPGQELANIEAKAAARGVSVDALIQGAVYDLASEPPPVAKDNRELPKIKRVPMKDRIEDIRWINEHRAECAGKWVAVDSGRLLAAGDEAKEVLNATRAARVPEPLLDHVFPPGPYMSGF